MIVDRNNVHDIEISINIMDGIFHKKSLQDDASDTCCKCEFQCSVCNRRCQIMITKYNQNNKYIKKFIKGDFFQCKQCYNRSFSYFFHLIKYIICI